MKLEEQVCSLELAKKLKELGVKQESLWSWCENKVNEYYIPTKPVLTNSITNEWVIPYSAFTVAELGKLLRDKDEYTYFLWGYYLPKRDCFDLILESSDRDKMLWETRAKTEANARAKMLIYLLENKLVEVEGR